ncbi:MAG: GNAT family N-acetyltransferase [Thermoplasmata archaeon]
MRCIAEPSVAPAPTPEDAPEPPVSLRGFRPSDLETIMGIVAEALHERYEPSLYATLSGNWPEGFLVAADENDRPTGFLLGVNQVANEGRVLMFAVDRHGRRRGVGTVLMRTFLDRCRARGLTRATLEVRVSNAQAIRLYARFRYSVVDLLRAYYSDGENGYQMSRPL